MGHRSLIQSTTYVLLLLASLFSLLSCTGNTDNNVVAVPKRITGTVINEANGVPVRDALITTEPPTEQVTTGSDGIYLIEDFSQNNGAYEVRVRHAGYQPETARITAAPGLTATVDFTLESTRTGLIASSSIMQFPRGVTSDSFLLTSSVEETSFSILTTDPWLSAFPTEGVISNSETFVIRVSIDNSILPGNAPLSSSIVINTNNGSEGVIINVQINTNSPDAGSMLGNNQTDCRRPDVLRVGYNNPIFDLIQFPQSMFLPQGAGTRTFQLPETNPALFDSIIVQELGEVTITHVNGASDNSTIAIFEMNLLERIVELASNEGVSETNQRASVSYALLPGIYCYYLGPTVGMFSLPTQLQVDISFQTANKR